MCMFYYLYGSCVLRWVRWLLPFDDGAGGDKWFAVSKLYSVTQTILSISLCRDSCSARRASDVLRYAAAVTFRNRTPEWHQTAAFGRGLRLQRLALPCSNSRLDCSKDWDGELFSFNELVLLYYSTRHQIACFKVTVKSYNVATRTAEPRRVKTAQN
jgi:hypothetical protein